MDSFEAYQLTVDQSVWRSKTSRPEDFNTALDLGHFVYTTTNIADSDGVNMPCIRIPVLDELCKAINASVAKATDNDAVQIESLYTSTLNVADGPGSQRRDTHYVTFTRAALVVSLADNQDTAHQGWDLTFKEKLGSDIVLPMVFSEIAISSEGKGLVASVFEFNTSMRGRLGARHAGQLAPIIDFEPSPDMALPQPPLLDILNAQDLILLPGYSDEKLQSLVHTYIYNAMLYHMDSSVRDKILKQKLPEVKPDQLPGSMADDLDQHAKDWFHDTYGPAYVSNAISQADPENLATWRNKLSEDDRLKVRYWFSGRGDSCLSHDRIFSRLNELANKEAIYSLLPGIRDFTHEPQYWADKLDAVLRSPAFVRSLQRTKESNGVNYSNKIANIMRTLDKEEYHTHTQIETSLAGSVAEALQNPYLLKSPENTARATGWVKDSIRHIITAALGEEDFEESLELSSTLRKSIQNDIAKFEKENKLSGNGSAIDRANAILNILESSKLLDGLSNDLSPFPESKDDGSEEEADDVIDGEEDATDVTKTAWETGVEGFDEIWDRQYELIFGTSPKAETAKGVVSIAYIAFKIKDAIHGFVDFDDKTGDERAAMIFKPTKYVVTIVRTAPSVWEKLRDPSKVIRKIGRGWIARKVSSSSLAIRVEQYMTKMVQEVREVLAKLSASPMALAMGISRRIVTQAAPKQAGWVFTQVSNPGKSAVLKVASKAPIRLGAHRESKWVLNVARRSFGIADIALSTAAQVLGIALAITSALSLAREWESMNDPQRALSVISLTISTLAIFTGEVFVASVCAALGVADATATAAVNAIPIVGQVLAAVGILIGIILAIIGATTGKKGAEPPPPDPVADFIDDVLKGLVRGWDLQPPNHLDVLVDSDTTPTKDKVGIFQVSAMNKSAESRLKMEKVTFSFKSGFKSASLFTNTAFTAVDNPSANRNARDSGNVFVDRFATENPCRVLCTSSLESRGEQEDDAKEDDKTKYTYVHKIIVTGVPSEENPRGTLDFPPRGLFRLNISGVGKGDAIADLEVVEEYEQDSVFHGLSVKPRKQ